MRIISQYRQLCARAQPEAETAGTFRNESALRRSGIAHQENASFTRLIAGCLRFFTFRSSRTIGTIAPAPPRPSPKKQPLWNSEARTETERLLQLSFVIPPESVSREYSLYLLALQKLEPRSRLVGVRGVLDYCS